MLAITSWFDNIKLKSPSLSWEIYPDLLSKTSSGLSFFTPHKVVLTSLLSLKVGNWKWILYSFFITEGKYFLVDLSETFSTILSFANHIDPSKASPLILPTTAKAS